MNVKVAGTNLVVLDINGAKVWLRGETQIRELIKMLTTALFELAGVKRQEVVNQ